MDEIIKQLEADAEEALKRYEQEGEEGGDPQTQSYEEGFSDGVMHAVRKVREALVEANIICGCDCDVCRNGVCEHD